MTPYIVAAWRTERRAAPSRSAIPSGDRAMYSWNEGLA